MNLYKIRWQKGLLKALGGYLRDILVSCFPLRRLPKLLRIAFLGVDPKFVFLVHPRRKADIYIAWPFAKPFRLLLRKYFYSFLKHLPPTILEVVRTPSGVNGIVLSSTWLPEALIQNRKAALQEARRCIRFAAKLSCPNAYLGLGEWWPFLTKRGAAVQGYASKLRVRLTSGYCGTLCSLQLSIKRISEISGLEPGQMKVMILGIGKMGTSVAKVLVNEVGQITIFDKNRIKQDRVAQTLRTLADQTCIKTLTDGREAISALAEHDVCVCTTSNLRQIITPERLPPGSLVLDDSRPEAIPRVYDLQRGILVMEGGLLRIRGVELKYDFGFGNHEEVFGCLGEAYLLAQDWGETLTPTVGDVDFEKNFRRMITSLERFGVEVGGFRSGSTPVHPGDIVAIILRKRQRILGVETPELCR